MDLRSLDPFVNDPPGRKNNLYKTPLLPTSSGIVETPMERNDENFICTEAISTGPGIQNSCLGSHGVPVNIVPPRRVQFDINVERARDEYYNKTHESFFSVRNPVTLIILAVLIALIFLNFTKR